MKRMRLIIVVALLVVFGAIGVYQLQAGDTKSAEEMSGCGSEEMAAGCGGCEQTCPSMAKKAKAGEKPADSK